MIPTNCPHATVERTTPNVSIMHDPNGNVESGVCLDCGSNMVRFFRPSGIDQSFYDVPETDGYTAWEIQTT